MTLFQSKMDFLSANSRFAVQNDGTYLPRITRKACIYLNQMLLLLLFYILSLFFVCFWRWAGDKTRFIALQKRESISMIYATTRKIDFQLFFLLNKLRICFFVLCLTLSFDLICPFFVSSANLQLCALKCIFAIFFQSCWQNYFNPILTSPKLSNSVKN